MLIICSEKYTFFFFLGFYPIGLGPESLPEPRLKPTMVEYGLMERWPTKGLGPPQVQPAYVENRIRTARSLARRGLLPALTLMQELGHEYYFILFNKKNLLNFSLNLFHISRWIVVLEIC